MVKLNNKEYITKIYENTHSYIAKFLTIKCYSTEDVSDLLQNTYIQFLEQIEKRGFAHILNPKHYLLRIAKAQLSKYYEGMKYSKYDSLETLQEDGFEKIDENFLLEEISENKMLSEQIWNAIKTLDDLTVKIFTLRFVYNMSLKEISKLSNIPFSLVCNSLYRGYAKIKVIIGEEN